MPAFGEFPIADALQVGEFSSTYEGRHITLLESEIIHPPGGDGMVDQYDPCVFAFGNANARGVGVALASAAAAGDRITLDTEGIFILDVHAEDDGGVGSAVAGGDPLYINTTSCVLSKITNIATQIPFGYALGIITATNTERIAVKVHFDPSVDNALAMFNTVISGGYGKSMRATLAGGASEGMCDYLEGHLSAAQTGNLYGRGSWINIDASELLDGSIITPDDVGIYAAANQSLGRVVFAGQAMAILNNAPASLHAWRLNVAAAAGAITALIAAANPGSVGYAPGMAGTGVVGTIPLADVIGTGVVYVDVHGAIA
ncbi:MAG: capsid cement protein [Dehalococcoidia bacterium]